MTQNEKNWEGMNTEVETEEEKDAVVVGGIPTENDASEVSDVNGTANDSVVDTTDEDVAAADNTEDSLEEETEESKGMSRREVIVLTVIGLLLLAFLIWLIFFGPGKAYRNGNAQNIDDISSVSETVNNGNESDTDGTDNDGNSSDLGNQGKNVYIGNGGSTGNQGNTNSKGQTTYPQGNGGNGNSGNNSYTAPADSGNGNSSAGNNGNTSGGNSNPQTDSGNGSGNNGNNTTPSKKDDAVPDYAGDTKVRICSVNDDTGVITVYVGDEYIAVPVQTTLFNGRITKSGVAQGKLQGYNCGATVMLYYPQTDGYQNTEFNGYMNRNSDSLTVLVDVNGTDCKLLIKINGMKSLF